MKNTSVGLAGIFAWLLLGFLAPVLALFSFNYFTDRYEIFHEGRGYISAINANYVRIEYLLEHGGDYEALLLGSSRADALNVDPYISGKSYTMSIAGGIVHYHYLHLKALVESGVIPKTVLLGLGEDAYRRLPEPNRQQHRFVRMHPRTENINRLVYYWDYLWYMPLSDDVVTFRRRLNRWLGNLEVMDEVSLKALQTGRFYCYKCENMVQERTPELHAETIERMLESSYVNGDYLLDGKIHIAEAIDTLKKIVVLAEQHEINLLIFMDPIYRGKYVNDDVQALWQFKKALSGVSPFLDFSNLDDTFANPQNFKDPIHYMRDTGARLSKDIVAAAEGRTDKLELGVWVTKDNVDAYLDQQSARFESLQQ